MGAKKRMRTCFSDEAERQPETNTQEVSFDVSMGDDAVERLLQTLIEQGDAIALKEEAGKIRDSGIKASNKADRQRLWDWYDRFIEASMLATSSAEPKLCLLGSRIRSMGYGSSASKHTQEIDEALRSCDEEDADRKGMMLAHPFYRSFLRHICNAGSTEETGTDNDTERKNKAFFSKQYADIWKQTKYGLVSTANKNNISTTSGPVATSLLSGTINQLVPVVLGNGQLEEWFPRWMSEFALKTSKTGESDKEPRSDGILGAPDPANHDALRALVSMEAKLSNFTSGDKAQSRSNACDAFSRQPEGSRPWPLLVLRFVLGEYLAVVNAFALVPTSEKSAKLVRLWEGGDDKAEAMYDCVVAALRASKEFLELVKKNHRAPLFCQVLNNVAFQEKDLGSLALVHKSFVDTKRGHVNLDLVRDFVDPDVKECRLGDRGSFIEMRDVGPVLYNGDRSCRVNRFIEIGNDLESLHEKGKTHGDIRLSNLILGGAQGKIVDWDLAGDTGEKKYPAGLQPITDGARHAEVEAAIADQSIGDLPLKNDHDWESFRAVMRCFAPAEERLKPAWEHLIKDISQRTTRSAAREDFKVTLVSEVGPLKVATGTPSPS